MEQTIRSSGFLVKCRVEQENIQQYTPAKYMCLDSKAAQSEIAVPVTYGEVNVNLSSLEIKFDVPLDWIPAPSVSLRVFFMAYVTFLDCAKNMPIKMCQFLHQLSY